MSPSSEAPAVHLSRSALTTLAQRCASLGDTGINGPAQSRISDRSRCVGRIGNAPAELLPDEFWSRLNSTFLRTGLGSVAFELVSPGIGAVAWRGSIEAEGT